MHSSLRALYLGCLALGVWSCNACISPPKDLGRGNVRIQSFRAAKKLMKEVYRDHRQTLYCNCSFDESMNIIVDRCDFRAIKPSKRADRVEWEHVVPAKVLGQTSSAWKQGHKRCITSQGKPYKGRRCANRVDNSYRRKAADLYNLFPAVGAINNARGSLQMAEIPGEPRAFGACDFEISGGQVEPNPAVRGEIARTYLYFDDAYPSLKILNSKSRAQYETWSNLDPPDAWECLRASRIHQIQGNSNRFVQDACKKKER